MKGGVEVRLTLQVTLCTNFPNEPSIVPMLFPLQGKEVRSCFSHFKISNYYPRTYSKEVYVITYTTFYICSFTVFRKKNYLLAILGRQCFRETMVAVFYLYQ